MISYAEALRIVLSLVPLLPARQVALGAASGAVTASALETAIAVPGFANAAMDGYALAASNTRDATAASPVAFVVGGMIAAGATRPDPFTAVGAKTTSPEMTAWEIMTGAPMPAGTDAVMPVERAIRPSGSGQPLINVHEPVLTGDNVRNAGEDFGRGDLVVPAGTRLRAQHLMALAACGLSMVNVRRPPRVAILTTGSELVTTGGSLPAGRIHDANGPYLHALLAALGAEISHAMAVDDRPDALQTAIAELAQDADVVLSTGGVSAGRLDLVPNIVRTLGGEVGFHKVAIRPGKPILHARLPGGALLFGLPGNPIAVAVGMRFFVVPALRAMQGLPAEIETPASAAERVVGRANLRFFAKARVEVDQSGRRRVLILPGQESFRIAPLLKANAWAIVPEGSGEIEAGGTLMTVPLNPESEP